MRRGLSSNMRRSQVAVFPALLVLLASRSASADVGLSGFMAEEGRAYTSSPEYPGQSTLGVQSTATAELKLTAERLTSWMDCFATVYGRYDGLDQNRSIVDPHVVKCRARGSNWSLSVGYDVESWGLLEFASPSDVLNQRDLNDDIVTKRKLGQPMANLTVRTSGGTFNLYSLVGFTPLSFPGPTGRLRSFLAVDTEHTTYGSSLGRALPGGAARYSNAFGQLRLNAGYFFGYRPTPDFEAGLDAQGRPFLRPAYPLEHQGSLEVQATLGDLLLKGESALRLNSDGSYASAAFGVGLEYDVGTLFKGGQTVSVLLEYHKDTRTRTLIVPFTNDLIGGVRVALNDVRATELTAWADLGFPDVGAQVVAVDASTRILDGLRGAVGFRGMPAQTGPFRDLKRDNYLTLRLTSFF